MGVLACHSAFLETSLVKSIFLFVAGGVGVDCSFSALQVEWLLFEMFVCHGGVFLSSSSD
jgi:hypothetical protein